MATNKSSLARIAALLFIITAASKVAAFIGTIVFSHYFGANTLTDAYYAAGTIPNLINNSLTICALTQFIPIYSKCMAKEGKGRADEFTSNVLNSFVLFNVVLLILVGVLAPLLVRIAAPGFSGEALLHTRRMVILLSLSFPFTIVAQVLVNLYNANRNYLRPAIFTFLNHIIVILLTVAVSPRFGIYCYPFICCGAWAFQAIGLYIGAYNKLFEHNLSIDLNDSYLRQMLVLSVPVVIGTASDQINLAADNIICSTLSAGSMSALGYAHRIFNSVNGFVTSVLLTLYYPIIAKQYAENDRDGMDESIKKCIELLLLLTLPIMVILMGNSRDVVNVLLRHGAMTAESVDSIRLLLSIYCASLIFVSMKEFVTKLFYVIGNTLVPTTINIGCVVFNIFMSITLKRYFGVAGIAVATTITAALCTCLESAVLLRLVGGWRALKRHKIIDYRSICKILCVTGVSTTLMYSVSSFVSINSIIMKLCIAVIIFLVAFFTLSVLFGVTYVTVVLKRFI